MGFYVALFDSFQTPKYHAGEAIYGLHLFLTEKFDYEAPNDDEIFDDSVMDNYKELAEKWDYTDYRKILSKYNVNIEELAEKGFNLSKKESGEGLMFVYYASEAKLKRIALKNLKHDLGLYKDNSEKEKEVRQTIGKVKILEKPQDILDTMTQYAFPGDADEKKLAFNDFEEYLEYVFAHK